jgi:alkanesulfonate monooxygenase SsuD/methylene tetrahydromethanopterin reductase-like flavin-dependent oxidoreductase (luciferase family)
MTADFGLALVEAHPKSHLTKWMDDLDFLLPQLEGYFKSLWMTDHFFWGEQYAYECWTVMTYLAAKWPNFDVGSMVLGQNYRNPALLAKMAATLQVFSQGRLHLGVGIGWKEDEYRGYGYDMPSTPVRIEQLDDTYEILKRLWTQPGKVTYHGKHYSITDAILEPKPDPLPTLLYGGGGEKTMMLAARHCDWWNLSDASIGKLKERSAILNRHCEAIGRDPASIRKTWFGRVVTGRSQAEIQALATSVPGRNYTTDNAFVGTPSEIVEQMSEFVDAGASYFMIDILGLPDKDILAMLLEDILPRVK